MKLRRTHIVSVSVVKNFYFYFSKLIAAWSSLIIQKSLKAQTIRQPHNRDRLRILSRFGLGKLQTFWVSYDCYKKKKAFVPSVGTLRVFSIQNLRVIEGRLVCCCFFNFVHGMGTDFHTQLKAFHL